MTHLGSSELKACLEAVQAVAEAAVIHYVMSLPVHVEGREVVSFLFNREGRDFTDRDRACAEAIRPHLGHLHQLARALDARAAWGVPPEHAPASSQPLTAREREVLCWLCGGKTDCDIARILGISPRTVHKHLQRIYEKLGVETRTAAVSRYFFSTTTRPSFT